MDTSNIEKILPNCQLSELRPCASHQKVQFHLIIEGKKDITEKIVDIPKLTDLLKSHNAFNEIKFSTELGVVKARYSGAKISVLASGRVVVREVDNEELAKELLEVLAPLLKNSIF